jgi:hypothetical protein
MKIIYQTEDNTVAVITPSPKWAGTIEELAAKDVPTGSPYSIIEDTELPDTREFRNAWEVDEATLTDGVGQ